MPLSDLTPQQEFEAARRAAMINAGFFGKVRVTGKDREALLHRLTANEMRNLKTGETRVNLFTNAKGRVVDRVEMLAEEDSYLLLTSPGRAVTLQKWIEKYTFLEQVQAADLSTALGTISLFGAESAARLENVWGVQLPEISIGQFVKISWQGVEVLVHRPFAANPAAFSLIAPAASVPRLWQALLPQFTVISFSTYEALRVLQGIPAAEHEIVDDYNPHEIGLYPFINFDKGCYIGQEVIARLDSYQKVQRHLVGVQAEAEAAALNGAAVWVQDQEAGKLTSVAPAPRSGAVGLAVVRKALAQPGTEVTLKRENETFPARLTHLPFLHEI